MRLITLYGWIALAALPAWGQSQGLLTREGRYWMQTVEGSVPSGPGGRLRVNSVGSITVRGAAGSETRYTAKMRVRAESEAEAKRWLGQARIAATRQGYTAVMGVREPDCSRCSFSVDWQITTPRATQETILETRGGSLEVYDVDGRVNAETAGGSIQMDRIGRDVRASTAGGPITLGAIGGPVRCETAGGSIRLGTARGDAVLTTSGGSISAEEVYGTLRAETAGGSIAVRRVHGSVTAETSGGSIHLARITGRVIAETAGGSIVVEGAPGGVRAENANGSIRLLEVAGAFRAATAAGNIFAQLTADHPLEESSLETSMGDIIVLIPVGVKLSIRAHVDVAGGRNRIQCDFPEIRIRAGDESAGPRTLVAEGAINGGGPLLRIRNTTGTIQIKRR